MRYCKTCPRLYVEDPEMFFCKICGTKLQEVEVDGKLKDLPEDAIADAFNFVFDSIRTGKLKPIEYCEFKEDLPQNVQQMVDNITAALERVKK